MIATIAIIGLAVWIGYVHYQAKSSICDAARRSVEHEHRIGNLERSRWL